MQCNYQWLQDVHEGIFEWSKNVKNSNGEIKFSTEDNDLTKSELLPSVIFYTRIMNSVSGLSHEEKNELRDKILKFKQKDGFFIDKQIFRRNYLIRKLSGIKNLNSFQFFGDYYKIAETRQALATLLALGFNADTNSLWEFYERKSLKKFLSSLNFKKPWNANSHINHVLFSLKYNSLTTDEYKKNVAEFLIDYAVHRFNLWIDNPAIPDYHKIGGLMKLVMGAKIFSKERMLFSRKIRDLIDNWKPSDDACEQFNYLFIKVNLNAEVDTKLDILTKSIPKNWNQYLFKDGGFSFHKNKSSTNYMDAKISKGLTVPDLHGTAMFVWGCQLLEKIESGRNSLFKELIM